MIAHADPRFIAKEQTRQAQNNAQMTINAVLWQIIKEQASVEEGEEEHDAVLTVPFSELKDIPEGMTLEVLHNKEDEAFLIKATVKEKKNIILPGQG